MLLVQSSQWDCLKVVLKKKYKINLRIDQITYLTDGPFDSETVCLTDCVTVQVNG